MRLAANGGYGRHRVYSLLVAAMKAAADRCAAAATVSSAVADRWPSAECIRASEWAGGR